MTQHMQDTVSRAASAEHRHELSHSQAEGRALGVAQAAHRHFPHRTQIIDSVGEVGEGGEGWEGGEGLSGGLQGEGAEVITGELVAN